MVSTAWITVETTVLALAEGLHWLECHRSHTTQVAGSISAQGAHLGWGFNPCQGVYERHSINVFLFLSSLFLSLQNQYTYPLE